MNSRVPRSGKRAAEDDADDGPPFKRKRQGDTASRMRDRIDFGEGSSMTGSQNMSALSQLDQDPLSDIIFEEEDLVLPFETPWNGRDSKQPVRYLRDYRILRLKSQNDFCISSIHHTSLEFEEQEELPHFLGFIRYKAGDPCEREERTTKDHELLVLSSKIWRAWWDRDPDTSERYVLCSFSHETLGQAAIRSHWLQTQFATYILEEPHQGYKIYHDNQAMLMGITRRLIQAVRIRPSCSLPNALNKFQRVAREIRNEEIDEQELRAIVCPQGKSISRYLCTDT